MSFLDPEINRPAPDRDTLQMVRLPSAPLADMDALYDIIGGYRNPQGIWIASADMVILSG